MTPALGQDALKNDEHGFFGQEAIDTMVKLMDDHRDEVLVIVAGYSDRMGDFLRANPGLASRFSGTIEFPNYTTAELQKIFTLMAAERGGYLLSACGLGCARVPAERTRFWERERGARTLRKGRRANEAPRE